MEHLAARTLELNEIGVCTVTMDRPVAFDPYTPTATPVAS